TVQAESPPEPVTPNTFFSPGTGGKAACTRRKKKFCGGGLLPRTPTPSTLLRWPAKHRRKGIGNFNLIAERVFGNASDDRSRDIVQIVRCMRIVYKHDLEPASQRAPNRGADTHLGQQTRDGNPDHTFAC